MTACVLGSGRVFGCSHVVLRTESSRVESIHSGGGAERERTERADAERGADPRSTGFDRARREMEASCGRLLVAGVDPGVDELTPAWSDATASDEMVQQGLAQPRRRERPQGCSIGVPDICGAHDRERENQEEIIMVGVGVDLREVAGTDHAADGVGGAEDDNAWCHRPWMSRGRPRRIDRDVAVLGVVGERHRGAQSMDGGPPPRGAPGVHLPDEHACGCRRSRFDRLDRGSEGRGAAARRSTGEYQTARTLGAPTADPDARRDDVEGEPALTKLENVSIAWREVEVDGNAVDEPVEPSLARSEGRGEERRARDVARCILHRHPSIVSRTGEGGRRRGPGGAVVSGTLFVLAMMTAACGPKLGGTSAGQDGTAPGDAGSGSAEGTSEPTGTTETGTVGASGDGSTGAPVENDLCDDPLLSLGCSLLAQNCPEGQRCTDVTYGPTEDWVCVDVLPDARVLGEACTPNPRTDSEAELGPGVADDCGRGLECVTEDGASTCRSLCVGQADDPQCEDPTLGCFFYLGNLGNACLFNYCRPRCDPLSPACAPGQVCDDVFGEFLCVTQWPPIGPPGSQCADGECGEGTLCVQTLLDVVSAGCGSDCATDPCACEFCYAICEIDGPPCASGICTAYNPEGDPMLESMGLCRSEQEVDPG